MDKQPLGIIFLKKCLCFKGESGIFSLRENGHYVLSDLKGNNPTIKNTKKHFNLLFKSGEVKKSLEMN